MSYMLNSIELPLGLYWDDKYSWSPVSQSVDISLTGALIVQEATQLAGRPITLLGGDDRCWANRSLIDSLYSLLESEGEEMTLNLGLDGIHTVIWNRKSNPLEVRPIIPSDDLVDTTLYIVSKLQFLKIG